MVAFAFNPDYEQVHSDSVNQVGYHLQHNSSKDDVNYHLTSNQVDYQLQPQLFDA
jgi:hypothetical protein